MAWVLRAARGAVEDVRCTPVWVLLLAVLLGCVVTLGAVLVGGAAVAVGAGAGF
jgi:hypothetical protein